MDSCEPKGIPMDGYTWRKTNYRLFQGRWGIAIELEAGWKMVSDGEDKKEYTKLAEHIYFYSMLLPYPDSQNLTAEELQCFCDGLKMICKYLPELLRDGSDLMIALKRVQFSDCYVQTEGFTASAILWASETFHFPVPTINVYFDKLKSECGMYVFDFSSV